MTKGKRYAVVVKLEESGDTSYQTYECTHNDSALTEAVSANEGESYVQYSDGEWEDFSKLVWSGGRKNNANLCIKMFSDTWDSTESNTDAGANGNTNTGANGNTNTGANGNTNTGANGNTNTGANGNTNGNTCDYADAKATINTGSQ